MDFLFLAFLFLLGLVSGAIATVGAGSAFIIFGALIFFGLSAQEALGTFKLAYLPMAVATVFYFVRKEKINWNLALPITFATLFGSALGAVIALSVGEQFLKDASAFFMLLIAFFLLAKKDFGISHRKFEEKEFKKRFFLAMPAASVFGVYAGFFGGGVGIVRSVLFAGLGLTFVEAMASKAFVSMLSGAVSAIVFFSAGQFNWEFGIPLAIGMLAGGLMGAKLSLKLGNEFMRMFLIALSIIFAAAIFLKII